MNIMSNATPTPSLPAVAADLLARIEAAWRCGEPLQIRPGDRVAEELRAAVEASIEPAKPDSAGAETREIVGFARNGKVISLYRDAGKFRAVIKSGPWSQAGWLDRVVVVSGDGTEERI